MNELSQRSSNFALLANVVLLGFLAALAEQVIHEGTHALVALVVGGNVEWFNLFAVSWSGEASSWAAAAIAGSAALVNILMGATGAGLLRRGWWRGSSMTRLFAMYFVAVSLLAGFGYLFFDPIVFREGMAPTESSGDWATVISILGGGWPLRITIFAVGAAGLFWSFKWLARETMSFNTRGAARSDRLAAGAFLLAAPYVFFCAIFSLLSLWHPLGSDGTVYALLKYWFGYFGFPVALLMMVTWPQAAPPSENPMALPRSISTALVISAVIGLNAAVLLLLPGVA
jgi:hypothetical protein